MRVLQLLFELFFSFIFPSGVIRMVVLFFFFSYRLQLETFESSSSLCVELLEFPIKVLEL